MHACTWTLAAILGLTTPRSHAENVQTGPASEENHQQTNDDGGREPPTLVPPPPPARLHWTETPDRFWRLRRGIAVGLVTLGSATLVAAVTLIGLREHKKITEQTHQRITYRLYDLRRGGYGMLGLGAAIFSAGFVWLMFERRLRQARAQARVTPGFGTLEVRF